MRRCSSGSGHAGAELTLEEYNQAVTAAQQNADSTITGAKETLGIPDAEVRLLKGDPGPAICQLATKLYPHKRSSSDHGVEDDSDGRCSAGLAVTSSAMRRAA